MYNYILLILTKLKNIESCVIIIHNANACQIIKLPNKNVLCYFFAFIKQTRDVIHVTQKIYDCNYLIHVALIYNAYRLMLCLFIYLYGFFFRSTREFSLIWKRLHCRWRVANFDLTRQSWPLSSEGSLAFHTYCDTSHQFIMVISEGPGHSHLMLSVWQTKVCRGWDSNTNLIYICIYNRLRRRRGPFVSHD